MASNLTARVKKTPYRVWRCKTSRRCGKNRSADLTFNLRKRHTSWATVLHLAAATNHRVKVVDSLVPKKRNHLLLLVLKRSTSFCNDLVLCVPNLQIPGRCRPPAFSTGGRSRSHDGDELTASTTGHPSKRLKAPESVFASIFGDEETHCSE